jgi:hypothetical protein
MNYGGIKALMNGSPILFDLKEVFGKEEVDWRL